MVALLAAAACGSSSRPGDAASQAVTRTKRCDENGCSGGTTTTLVTRHLDLTLTGPDSSPSCADAERLGHLSEVLSAFRAARIRGRGAEDCMSDSGLRDFCGGGMRTCSEVAFESDPGPICLYGCLGHRIVDMTFDASATTAGTVVVYVQVTYEPEFQSGPHASPNEFLTVRNAWPHGQAVPRNDVIVHAQTSA